MGRWFPFACVVAAGFVVDIVLCRPNGRGCHAGTYSDKQHSQHPKEKNGSPFPCIPNPLLRMTAVASQMAHVEMVFASSLVMCSPELRSVWAMLGWRSSSKGWQVDGKPPCPVHRVELRS
jgi:hypothetical protein